ncbi:hypothetical protein B0J18DRAFT_298292 [Chaetomium sp. MPI-SDFR-AT-0129]|nr:hypothetical protein B0J18DRAFT_298292 [Chaetomium sp. MPI-SDFR-AT-0129]
MGSAEELTVGQASGLIAFGNAMAAFTIPLFLTAALVRWYNQPASAATWTVIARQLHSSLWPTLLRTDSVASTNVHWTVTAIAYANVSLAVLLLISGIVTPLGLSDKIGPIKHHTAVRFEYAPDLSTYGASTLARPGQGENSHLPGLSRDCLITSTQCPGIDVKGFVPQAYRYRYDKNGTVYNASITSTTRIPQNLTDMFRSHRGRFPDVAGIFDLQYRVWRPLTSEFFDDEKPYPAGRMQHVDMLIPRDGVVLVEGAIADFSSGKSGGGIGFRNHSAPSQLDGYGAQWTEDVLWIEPDIACSATNLSLEFVLGDIANTSSPVRSAFLVDDGGFARLRHGNPYDRWPSLNFSAPDVRLRADRSAQLSNFLLGIVFNITDDMLGAIYGFNTTIGARYPVPKDSSYGYGYDATAETLVPLGVRTSRPAGGWLGIPSGIGFNVNGSVYTDYGETILKHPIDHPYEYGVALLTQLQGRCSGEFGDDATRDDYNVACTYFFGAPQRVDRGSPLLQEDRSKWKLPMHVCAGASKASIKTVSFAMNSSTTNTGTDANTPHSIENLVVQSIKPKQYTRESDYPLWAIEDWWSKAGAASFPAPLWGIVDDRYNNTPGYNFTRAPSLYLPKSMLTLNIQTGEAVDMLAGASAPWEVLDYTMSEAFDRRVGTYVPTYNGANNLALQAKWASLSKTAEGAATALRLVWTDLMASAVVGTSHLAGTEKVAINKRAADDAAAVDPETRIVTTYGRKLAYDMRFAIPAIVLLCAWLAVFVFGIVLVTVHGHLPSHIRKLLNDTSVGRIAATMVDADTKALLATSTDHWVKSAGRTQVALGMESGGSGDRDGRDDHDIRDGESVAAKSGKHSEDYAYVVEPQEMELLPQSHPYESQVYQQTPQEPYQQTYQQPYQQAHGHQGYQQPPYQQEPYAMQWHGRRSAGTGTHPSSTSEASGS